MLLLILADRRGNNRKRTLRRVAKGNKHERARRDIEEGLGPSVSLFVELFLTVEIKNRSIIESYEAEFRCSTKNI